MNFRERILGHMSEHRFTTGTILASTAVTLVFGYANAVRGEGDGPAPTVAIDVAETGDAAAASRVDVSENIVVVPLRVLAEGAESSDTANEEIDKNFAAAYKYMRYDFDDRLNLKALPVQTVYEAPEGKEILSGAHCFTFGQLGKLALDLKQNYRELAPEGNLIAALVMDKVDQCETIDDDGTVFESPKDAPANASAERMTFKSDFQGKAHVNPAIIMHETGHMIGLGHVGEFGCDYSTGKDIYDPYDPALRDITRVVAGPECSPLYHDGINDTPESIFHRYSFLEKANGYAGRSSVMGDLWQWDDERIENGMIPAFSTLDRSRVMPDIFQIDQVAPVPGTFEVSNETGALNGIRFALPDGHVLRRAMGDAQIDELVVAVEEFGASIILGEEFKEYRRCGDRLNCGLRTYAVSSSTGFRIELPLPVGYASQDDDGNSESIIYLDEELGIGIIEGSYMGDLSKLEVVSYAKAQDYKNAQISNRANFLDGIHQDDIDRLLKSGIARGALTL